MLIHACLDAQLYTVVHGALGGHNLTLPLARPRLRWRCSQRAAQLLPIFGNPLSVGDSSRCDPAGTPSDAGGWGRAPASEIDACARETMRVGGTGGGKVKATEGKEDEVLMWNKNSPTYKQNT